MNPGTDRYKIFPDINDSTGFFNSSVPYTLGRFTPDNDSIAKFFNVSNLPSYQKEFPADREHLVTSIFIHHNLKSQNKYPVPLGRFSNDWMTIVVIISLFLFAWIQNSYSKRLHQIIKSVLQPYFVNQLEREGNPLTERVGFGLRIIFILSASLAFFELAESYAPGTLAPSFRFRIFLAIVSGFIGYLLFKSILVRFVGELFKNRALAHSHEVNNLVFEHVAGLLFFIGSALTYLTGIYVFAWISVGSGVVMYIWRTTRLTIVGINDGKLSLLNLFFYLCTLEILPVLIIMKTVINLLNN